MGGLSDKALDRLRDAIDWPDLSGTRYEPIESIGQGGMATVFRVRDKSLDRDVALKVLRLPDTATDVSQRLLKEAHILADLEHPGIVPVHDIGELPDGRVFYVMKLVRGRRLDEFARESTDLADLLRVFERICEPVSYAHARGVIHRDLKPENVMVGEYGEVLVLDWGVAKFVGAREGQHGRLDAERDAQTDDSTNTRHGTVIGTPGYMAPEQARGAVADVDSRADVYSLGAILTFLLGSNAPAPLAAVCKKAMAEDPPERYESVDALRRDLALYQQRMPIGAYRESVIDRAGRLFSKHKTAILLIAGYLLLRVLLIIFGRT